ncbi:xylose isomerase-like protein [Elsinoe ampelina]|uniref:Xylose isomerase-like protein n=1 Tax=Elsinoe ampelina TaxID=302913 RepID=A0A6A6GDM4_9PEZI|nr:xylose isomerase-like protein [Elsinoe ampelina]
MPCRPGISSMSLGRAWVHGMRTKLEQAAKYGFEGVEIFYEDLEYLADSSSNGKSHQGLRAAAQSIRNMCDELGLIIINLQPFSQYDGLRDRSKHAARLEEMKLWFELADIMRTDLIQIPASFLPPDQATGDIYTIVSDLRIVADLGLQRNPPIRFAYESLCFSTYIDTWEKCWDVVQRVDRPNFGICLDTYNIAGRVYADPAAPTGKTEDAEIATTISIQNLVKTLDVSKVFFIQVVDAELLSGPLVEGHEFYDKEQPARMSWSRNCRLFYGEEDRGAYLPVREITKAIINGLGFQGWVSMELFNRSMSNPSPTVPQEHARRGMVSWSKIQKDTQLVASPPRYQPEQIRGPTANMTMMSTHSEPRLVSIP